MEKLKVIDDAKTDGYYIAFFKDFQKMTDNIEFNSIEIIDFPDNQRIVQLILKNCGVIYSCQLTDIVMIYKLNFS